MEKIVPISDLQSKAKKLVEQVKSTGEPIIITQRGRAAAVIMNYDAYEGHFATLDEMSYPDWRERLTEAEQNRGQGVELQDYLLGKRSYDGKK
jgi:prevent-host-death family protein